jgi:hypothetical protein
VPCCAGDVLVVLDLREDEELQAAGLAREVRSRIGPTMTLLYFFVIEEILDRERRKASKQYISGSGSCGLFLLWRRVHALD